jgi:hypothetical protein
VKRLIFGCDGIVGNWVAGKIGGHYNGEGKTIGIVRDELLIAGAIYELWNGVSIAMQIAASEPNWLTRSALWVLFDYPFNQVGAAKILAFISQANLRSQRLAKHAGFIEETRITKACPGGDLLVYTMTRAQCRFLVRPKEGLIKEAA